MRSASLVLLSGGLDSALGFSTAVRESDIVCALTFDYGQRAAKAEISAAKKICKHFDVAHKVIELPFFSELAGHPFFDDKIPPPEMTGDDLDDERATQRSAHAVWVPNRNGIFLNIAAAFAEMSLANEIYVGFNIEEAKTFPDNSKEFVDSTNKALQFSTRNHVKVMAPTISMNKKEIVKKLVALDFPLKLLWSCYIGGDTPCGHCESCQ